MKNVGFGGTPFKDQPPRDEADDEKQWAVSPLNFTACALCGITFEENQRPRFKQGTMIPAHQACLDAERESQ